MWDLGYAAIVIAYGAHVVLAVLVLAAAPSRPGNRALALYGVSSGMLTVAIAVAEGLGFPLQRAGTGIVVASIASYALSAVALVWLGLVYPSQPKRDVRLASAAFVACAVAFIGGAWAVGWHLTGARQGEDFVPLWGFIGNGVAEMLANGVRWGVLVLFALRYGHEPEHRRVLTSLTVALSASVALRAGQFLTPYTSFPFPGEPVLRMGWALLGLGSVVGLWLWQMARAQDPRRIWAMAWTPLAAAAVGMMLYLAEGVQQFLVAEAAVGLLAVSLLGYALIGEAKPRRARRLRASLGGSSMAALAIAGFFVASETAQQFFGSKAGPYAGIAITGFLVLAAAPLQRAAEGLGNGSKGATPPRGGAEQAFRAALQLAIRDTNLSSQEALALAVLADELGISHRRAHELQAEALARVHDGAKAAP